MSSNTLYKSKEKGFLEIIVIVLIALILLRFLGISVDGILAKEGVKEFFAYTKDMLVLVWEDVLKIVKAVKS
jgi:hypothetical protein